ncbi:MAG: hypothetical protein IJR59_05930 [Firmicutes bacterium]|nr:hypothetical protein [Bacillota bacterium]
MKFYKKTMAVLMAAVVGIVPFFAQSATAQDGEVSVYDVSAPAKDSEGYYLVGTADELYWIADRVNKEYYMDVKVKLTQDIAVNPGEVTGADATLRQWVPLGGDTYNFVGEIDGQGHKITGLCCYNRELSGLIGYNHGVVRNLGIENSFFSAAVGASGAAYAGSIAAAHNEGIISGCYSNARVVSNFVTGGLCGGINNSAVIENCYFSGTVNSTKNKSWAKAIAYVFGNGVTVSNCYFLNGSDAKATKKSSSYFSSGEVTFLLNLGGGNFYQNIDNGKTPDAFPVLDPSHGVVLMDGSSYTNNKNQPTTEPTTETTTEATTEDPGNNLIYGGANAEPQLSASDAALILQKVLNGSIVMPIESLTNNYEEYIDVDDDGFITASDAALVMQKVLKEDVEFPAEKNKR